MSAIVYDSISYFAEYDGRGLLVEGYDGFQVRERGPILLVVYKEISHGKEIEKKYPLQYEELDLFLQLHKLYGNFFEKQKTLFNLLVSVERRISPLLSDQEIKEVCDDIWEQNRVHFAAMNINRTQFYLLVKQRICVATLAH